MTLCPQDAGLQGVRPYSPASHAPARVLAIPEPPAAIIGTLIAPWSANAAMKAMMDALNIAYGTQERRSFIRLNLVSLFFTFSAILGLIMLFWAVAAVPVFLDFMWLGGTADFLIWAGRWPVIFVLVILALAVLYRFGPSRPGVRWR